VTANAIEFPSDLEILMTRDFEAPIELVFDVFTKEEHVRNTFPPFGEEMAVCDIDLRVGGEYHYVMVTADGREMSFRGIFLEIEPPTRMAQTWLFEGWANAEAVETVDFHETGGVTTMTWKLTFRDRTGRDHMTQYDGIESSWDNVEAYLRTLQAA
jgi:uncharacterized protein YndB with AHSA1/START domain